jgi:hypothetical protein
MTNNINNTDDKKYLQPKNERNRLNDVDSILKFFNDKDIPDSIIKKIHKLYPTTKKYNFLRTEQLEIGMIIKLVSLDLEKIYTNSVILKIDANSSQKYGSLLVYVTSKDKIFRVKPDKFYIFQIEKSTLNSIDIIDKLKTIKNKYDKNTK